MFITIVRPFKTKRPIEEALRRLTTASRQTPAVEDRRIYSKYSTACRSLMPTKTRHTLNI